VFTISSNSYSSLAALLTVAKAFSERIVIDLQLRYLNINKQSPCSGHSLISTHDAPK